MYVKNGFSHLTKEKISWVQHRKEVMNNVRRKLEKGLS